MGFLVKFQHQPRVQEPRQITGRFSRALAMPTFQPPCIRLARSCVRLIERALCRSERASEARVRLKQCALEMVLNLASGRTSLRAASALVH